MSAEHDSLDSCRNNLLLEIVTKKPGLQVGLIKTQSALVRGGVAELALSFVADLVTSRASRLATVVGAVAELALSFVVGPVTELALSLVEPAAQPALHVRQSWLSWLAPGSSGHRRPSSRLATVVGAVAELAMSFVVGPVTELALSLVEPAAQPALHVRQSWLSWLAPGSSGHRRPSGLLLLQLLPPAQPGQPQPQEGLESILVGHTHVVLGPLRPPLLASSHRQVPGVSNDGCCSLMDAHHIPPPPEVELPPSQWSDTRSLALQGAPQ